MKIALIGGVSSTMTTLGMLRRYEFEGVDVYGYEPKKNRIVSCYNNLKQEAERCGYAYYGFEKINDHSGQIQGKKYDFIFVVGLSQLVNDDIVTSAQKACIGFHPTKLPHGRGRAPIAWLILEGDEGAATFFKINPDQGADAGEILAQSPFPVDRTHDTVATIEQKILEHIEIALHELLPKLRRGDYEMRPQDDSLATEYGVRRPEDGYVDWRDDSNAIEAHIRSAMPPHPGAFAFVESEAFEISLSGKKEKSTIKGVVGRVLKKDGNHYLVQAGRGNVWIETKKELKVGTQLGVCSPWKIHSMEKRILELEKIVSELFNKMDK